MNGFHIRPLKEEHHNWLVELLKEHWGSTIIVTRGHIHHADKLPGFVAVMGNRLMGLVAYHIDKQECEIVTLNSIVEKQGFGTALVKAVKRAAVSNGCKRLWLVTTNDNLAAVRFYQKRGFTLVGLHRNAVEKSRKLKPEIPLIGIDGIPIRDEIELEIIL